jgi:nucleoside-diphosphate-sugar epimerase
MRKDGASGAVRRVAVTGATGMIGRPLVRRLADRGHHVVAFARTADELAVTGVDAVSLDVTDPDAVQAAVASAAPEVIVHLAADVAGGRGVDQVLPTLRTNLLGTAHVLVAARNAGCRRVVLAGTLLQGPRPDSDPPVPASPYGASKWAADGYARMFDDMMGLPTVILRLSMVYGPGQRDVTKVVPYVITTTLRGATPQLTSGTWTVDWVYVDDAVEAFALAVERPEIDGRTIDVCSGEQASVRSVVERLLALLGAEGRAAFGAVPDRPSEWPRDLDPTGARTALGWAPRVRLDEGLARTVRWFAERDPESGAGSRPTVPQNRVADDRGA